MESGFERGEAEPSFFDTQEMEAVRGGDADTGVEFPNLTDDSAAPSAQEDSPVPEGHQFPSRVRFYGD